MRDQEYEIRRAVKMIPLDGYIVDHEEHLTKLANEDWKIQAATNKYVIVMKTWAEPI